MEAFHCDPVAAATSSGDPCSAPHSLRRRCHCFLMGEELAPRYHPGCQDTPQVSHCCFLSLSFGGDPGGCATHGGAQGLFLAPCSGVTLGDSEVTLGTLCSTGLNLCHGHSCLPLCNLSLALGSLGAPSMQAGPSPAEFVGLSGVQWKFLGIGCHMASALLCPALPLVTFMSWLPWLST